MRKKTDQRRKRLGGRETERRQSEPPARSELEDEDLARVSGGAGSVSGALKSIGDALATAAKS